MKETDFIEENKEKWASFEKNYASARKDPELLSSLYLDIINDLGYAKTFYNRRTVRVYLNNLARKVFVGVHRQGDGESRNKLIEALTISLPLELYRARKSLFFALISFLVYVLLGATTTYFYPEFPRLILGNAYVDQTLINIENGHPLAIYESESQWQMFYYITTNNIGVAFLVFVMGLLATLGTHALLFTNGVMLGTFQTMFYTHGLLATSFSGIWIHGAFEITAIVIAAGAGITMGNGWLFPGSYTRSESFRMSVMRGLKIMFSVVPFIVIAGFLESFVTHNYQLLPAWSKWGIILFSFGMIFAYYVVYPFIVAQKYPERIHSPTPIAYRKSPSIVLYKIRSLGAIIQASFQTYARLSLKFLPILLLVVFPLGLLVVLIQGYVHIDRMFTLHLFDWYAHAQIMFGFGMFHLSDMLVGGVWSVIVVGIFAVVFWSIKSMDALSEKTTLIAYLKERFLFIYLSSLPFYALFFFTPIWAKFVLIFILPFFTANIAYVALTNDTHRILLHGFRFGRSSYKPSFRIIVLFSCFIAVCIQPIASVFSIQESYTLEPWAFNDLLDVLADFVYTFCLELSSDKALYYANVVRQIVYLLFAFIALPLFVLLLSFSYFSTIENSQAISLWESLKHFGKRKKWQE